LVQLVEAQLLDARLLALVLFSAARSIAWRSAGAPFVSRASRSSNRSSSTSSTSTRSLRS
jgi:hypothetical protein